MKDVVVLIGTGQIGQVIARRIGVGKHVLLADIRTENANAAAEIFKDAGFESAPLQSTYLRARRWSRSRQMRPSLAILPD